MLWKYLLTVVLLLLVVGVLAVELIPLTEVRWVGGYDLTVHLDAPAGQPTVVICSPIHGRRDDAEESVTVLRMFPASTRLTEIRVIEGRKVVADPFVGGPLKVFVKTIGRQSALGRELSASQEGFLIVGAEWPDGRRVWKVVEIPDGRASREVRVSLP
jgi:hypothetical protein